LKADKKSQLLCDAKRALSFMRESGRVFAEQLVIDTEGSSFADVA
jgi:hypothetical protein